MLNSCPRERKIRTFGKKNRIKRMQALQDMHNCELQRAGYMNRKAFQQILE